MTSDHRALPDPAIMGGSEPATDRGPVRRFRDPAYQPVAATLAELRAQIDAIDRQLVVLIAARARCVRDATRFKRDAYQVAAPARQAEVFDRVRRLAVEHEAVFPGLSDVVDATWRSMVGGFVACEGRMFQDTEEVNDESHDAEPGR
jgi:isochorismate pyruvate lyase